MALILCDYINLGYFVNWRGSFQYFERGDVSYFDPKERKFLRINPSRGDVPDETWIALPVIKEVDVVKNYFRYRWNSTILQDYIDLNDHDFCVKVAFLADEYGIEDGLYNYVMCCYGEIISKWAEDNHIPNCKLHYLERFDLVHADEQEVLKFRREQIRLERLQEEEFKKSLQ